MLRSVTISALVVGLAVVARTAYATDTSVPFIHADDIHAQGIYGRGVTVAVIDTGVDLTHPGLFVSIAPGGLSWINGQPVFDGGADIFGLGHGTYMSLIIADYTGVAPLALILPVRVFGADGTVALPDLILAIQYVTAMSKADHSTRVINLSLGTLQLFPCSCDLDVPDFAAAVSDAASEGIITLAATGNEAGCGGICAPACVSSAVKVAADYDSHYGFVDHGVCGDPNALPYRVTCFSNNALDERPLGTGRPEAGLADPGETWSGQWNQPSR